MPDDLTLDEVRSLAREMGLARIAEAHLEELVRATRAARARRSALRVDTLEPADEPAHVFRVDTGAVR
jgi:hypothetical protein